LPAVEESRSLYKIIKNDGSAKKDQFMPHHFQKIDIDRPLIRQEEAEKAKGFKPAELSGKCGFYPDSGKKAVEDGNSFEALKKKAYTDGFMKGEKSGIESERKRLQTIFVTFDKAIEESAKLKNDLYLDAERGAVELALAIAEKVVSHEISVNKETVLGILKEALKKVVDQEKIKIRINKLDIQLINESGYRISELTGNIKDVVVEGDDTISRGGCVIETGFGSIDARIESQLEAVGDLLRSEMP